MVSWEDIIVGYLLFTEYNGYGRTDTEIALNRKLGIADSADVVTESGQALVDAMTRAAMIPYMVAQRIMSRRERISHQQAGIEQTLGEHF